MLIEMPSIQELDDLTTEDVSPPLDIDTKHLPGFDLRIAGIPMHFRYYCGTGQ